MSCSDEGKGGGRTSLSLVFHMIFRPREERPNLGAAADVVASFISASWASGLNVNDVMGFWVLQLSLSGPFLGRGRAWSFERRLGKIGLRVLTKAL